MSQSQVQADEGTAIPASVAEYSRYPQMTIRLLKVPLIFGSKKKTHICMECVAEVERRKRRRRNDWYQALCNGSNVSNMWKHLKTHKVIYDEELKAVLNKRENERKKEYVSVETGVKKSDKGETNTSRDPQRSIVGMQFTTDKYVNQKLSEF